MLAWAPYKMTIPSVIPEGSTSRLTDPQRDDGTTPTCAGLPPQPHPKRLIKRDTLPTWSRLKRKLLAHAVHLGSSTENSPDWSTIHYTARALERRPVIQSAFSSRCHFQGNCSTRCPRLR